MEKTEHRHLLNVHQVAITNILLLWLTTQELEISFK